MIIRYLAAIFIFLLPMAAFSADEMSIEEDGITAEELFKTQEDDVVIGDKNAPVTIIEYASLSCSHCASFHNNTFPELKEKYIDKGKVKFIFRDFPLDEPALRGSMMARCAAKKSDEDYLKFIKVMFSTQSNWAPKKNYLEILSNIGKLGGMPGNEFELCIADQNLEHSIMKGKFFASKYLEVRSTPTLFINNEMHKGAKGFSYISKVIDEILEKKDNNDIDE